MHFEWKVPFAVVILGTVAALLGAAAAGKFGGESKSTSDDWPEWSDAATTASFEDLSCGAKIRPDPERYVRHVKDLRLVNTLTIEGPEWNNTLVENCQIADVNGDGIEIRNVQNLAIFNCKIDKVSGTGIRLRSSGGTSDVWLIENSISNTGLNGISVAKRFGKGVDHKNLAIIDNTVSETGHAGETGHTHGIYTQSSDVTIFGNVVEGDRDGNGISIRSSGLVACNEVSGRSRDGKPGIRYFADHVTGPSRRLTIRHNIVRDASPAIHLMPPADEFRQEQGKLVSTFVIHDNRATSDEIMSVDNFWWGFELMEFESYGNSLIDE